MSVPSRLRPSSIEVLEARIAPALLVHGANLLGGAGNPTTGEASIGGETITVAKVLSGQAVVWYDGFGVTGISFGPNTRLEITGSVGGDIVGNLTAEGRLSDSDNNPLNGEDGDLLLPNNLLGLKVLPFTTAGSGSVFSSIVTGGNVSNVDVNFILGGIYAGDGIFHAESLYNLGGTVTVNVGGGIDVNPVTPGVQEGFEFTVAKQTAATTRLTAGASINNVSVGKAVAMQVISGSGAPPGTVAGSVGAKGGDIVNVTIDVAETPESAPLGTLSYQFIAGDGATGARGGAGGMVNKVIERASSGAVEIRGGQGGIGTAGPGGAGGSIFNLDLQSSTTAYTVTAGDGAQGTPGGAGGDVHFVNFANRTSNSGLVFTGDFTGDDIIDVAIVDGGTGRIVIAEQAADGTFSLVTQYIDPDTMLEITIIEAAGTLPTDGAAVDVDGDSDLDLVIAYRGSNSVAVLFNQGDGSFYNTSDPMNPALQVASTTVFGSPVAIDIDPADPDRIVVAGSGQVDGRERGTLELLALTPGVMGAFTLGRIGTETIFLQPLTDAAFTRADSGFNGVVVSQRNGELFTADIAQQPADQAVPAFTNIFSFDQLIGGVRRIDISSDGTVLAVLGSASVGILLYDLTGLAPNVDTVATLPSAGLGNPAVMRFVDDGLDDTPDTLFVLSGGTGASRITQYVSDGLTPNGYLVSRNFDSSDVFRNFSGFGTAGAAGFAAVTSALNVFSFSPDFATVSTQTLPFVGKSVTIEAGDGGNGVESGLRIGNGGDGGSIMAVNAEGATISLTAGNGGNAQMGAGGDGGSLVNPASFTPASGGGAVAPRLLADNAIVLLAGNGGTPALAASTAAGGNGGSMRGLDVELISGDLVFNGGFGGNSRGGKAGTGGSLIDITSLSRDGDLTAIAGDGGIALAATGFGGAGGSVTNFRHTLLLEAETEVERKDYNVTIIGGAGGSAVGAAGGAGGGLVNVLLDLDNSDIDFDNFSLLTGSDGVTNPVTITLTAGAGGNGATGGAGGSVSGLNYTSHHDQVVEDFGIVLGYFTMSITAGAGGNGTAGKGGAGGSFLGGKPIAGITGFDPDGPAPMTLPLTITAGKGGDGTIAGGAGGIIKNAITANARFASGSLISHNHLEGATLTAGAGGAASAGTGGAGGGILNAKVGVAGSPIGATTSALFATAGAGGAGGGATGKGGAGGAITGGAFGLGRDDSADPSQNLNFVLAAGDGGAGGAAGGAGGALGKLSVSIQQASEFTGGVSILAAGAGGTASSSGGKGGKGGNVSNITQLQDLNSVITAIYAGDGGDAATGIGGAGGSATGIKTTGFIGTPSDSSGATTDRYGVVHPFGIPQGLFAGRGGDGTTDGKAGSVTNVSARQIAAIAALSATSGFFVAVEKVSNVRADVVGYDIDLDGVCDDIANMPIKPATPATVMAADGFIFAKTIANVIVNGGAPNAAFVFDV